MSELIPKHGGYRNLKSFQVSQLIYDMTVRFVERYIDRFSRTRDQMVQAARSGVQNIAEGSEASATSKKTELKLTQVARASLEELKLDYEDYLRQRGLAVLSPRHPALLRFKGHRCRTLEDLQAWVAEERGNGHTDGHGRALTNRDVEGGREGVTESGEKATCISRSAKARGLGSANRGSQAAGGTASRSVLVSDSPCSSISSTCLSSACLAANAALSLLNLACWLLDRQVERLAKDFENEGGFTERLYRVRTTRRRGR